MGKVFGPLLLILIGWISGWYAHRFVTEQRIVQESPLIEPSESSGLLLDFGGSSTQGPSKSKESLRAAITNLLDAQRFHDVVQLCQRQRKDAEFDYVNICRGTILAHSNRLKELAHYTLAIQLLTLYLNDEFRDVGVHEQLSRLHYLNRNYSEAIEALYTASAYAHQAPILERLSERREAIVSEYAAILESRKDYQSLQALYENLVQQEPSQSVYFLKLGEVSVDLEDYDNARQSLGIILYDPHVGEQARHLLSSLDSQSVSEPIEATQVPLSQVGDHFIVEAWINQHASVRLLIDTGASMTIIKPSAMKRQGVRYLDLGSNRWFNTAGGKVQAPIWRVGVFSLQDQPINQLDIVALELDSLTSVDGLLGMNYLKHFTFFIDQENAILRLSKVH